MNTPNIFSGDIHLRFSCDDGMTICCSQRIAAKVNTALLQNGIKCIDTAVEIPGTRNIHDFLTLTVESENISELFNIITSLLDSIGISHTKDNHTIGDDGEENIQISLNNYSVFDK